MRLLPTLLVLALLGSTAAAFAVTEALKLTPSPLSGTRVDPTFSPACRCTKDVARIGFRLRKADHLTITVVDGGGKVVRTLTNARPVRRGFHVFRWDGLTDAGTRAPDATYRPRVHLRGGHRTILLPNPIVLDTKPPEVESAAARPLVISPDRDGRSDKVTVRYRTNESAHGLLFRGAREVVHTRFAGAKMDWRTKRAGVYRLVVGAVDEAGNTTRSRFAFTVTVRYITLARRQVRVAAGARLVVGVSTDARRWSWRLGRRSGTRRGGRLVVRAPALTGLYRLVVSERGHSDVAKVFVR
jgi:hypothetical protein